MDIDEFDPTVRAVPQGGVTAARGFGATGVHAGFRKDPKRLDLALVVADEPCAAAGVFTRSAFAAAPVRVSRAHLGGARDGFGVIRGIVINSGSANAATGEAGVRVARETCDITSQVIGCESEQILVASTGVIGQLLDIAPFETGVPRAFEELSRSGGTEAAQAIMTTDTHPKECALTYRSRDAGRAGRSFTVGGMCKGSGMIMPNMATMIACLTTDAPVSPSTLRGVLGSCVAATFNKVTIDSDTSTNDTCLMLASGAADPEGGPIEEGSEAYEELVHVTRMVCENLARGIAADGEGASKLVTVCVAGAATDAEADALARSVANSPLVKTAIAGHDCNWGRIAMALGKSSAAFRQEDVAIDIMGIPVCRGGLTVEFDEREALRRFDSPEITISVDVGAGSCSTTVWTCDLTRDYITINGDYRT